MTHVLNFNHYLTVIDCEGNGEVEEVEVGANGIIITSPNHPNNYDYNKDCHITVRNSENKRVAIRFGPATDDNNLEFDVESVYLCGNDYVEIRDGNSKDQDGDDGGMDELGIFRNSQ